MPKPIYAKREYLSITTLMSFIRCPRSYFYKKSGLVPKEEFNALSYGTAMHKAVPIALTIGFDAAFAAFSELWDDSLADDKRSLRRAQAQLSHFAHTHKGSKSLYTFEPAPALPEGIEPTEDVSEYEVPAVIDVGLPVPIVVRIDGLVKHRDTGELWGWEFKTSSRLNSQLFDALEKHPQILAYTMVLRTITGKKVRGMIAEAMLIDKAKVDNITHPIPVKDFLVDDILLWIKYWGEQLLACEALASAGEDPIGAKAFPKNFAGCSSYPWFYMPSFDCEYSNLCFHAENWQELSSLYDIKEDHKFVKLTQGET